jgi:predicted metal-dependent hydrolase
MENSDVFIHDDQRFPIKVYKEWRDNIRYSLGSKYLIIRLPKHTPGFLINYHISEAKSWAQAKAKKRKPSHAKIARPYNNGDEFVMRDKVFQIVLTEENRKTFSGRVSGKYIFIKAPHGNVNDRETKAKLMSRIMGAHFHNDIIDKVNHYNQNFFHEYIKKVRLKNNKSNWGSCSSDSNLNFSTRLLFAPDDVIDYVVVHELSHLKEMNHSKRFWKIVSDVMPGYDKQEKWLKENSHLCDY